MDFQLRIRTDELFENLEYIKHWLDAAREGFAFCHDKPGNHHYHIYLFGLDRKPDPMRKYLAKYLPSKSDYAVGITAGKKKEPISPMIAYQYGTEEKLSDPVWWKGFEGKQEVFKLSAEAFYAQMKQKQERRKQVVTEILVINEEKVKPDRVWERLMSELIENPRKYDDKQVHQIKSMISAEYLRKLKAVPRPSDLHRYAVSLYQIVKHGLHENEHATIEDDALEDEYLR